MDGLVSTQRRPIELRAEGVAMSVKRAQSPKLLDQVRNTLRVLHYAWRTEQSYLMWIERFLKYHRDRNRGVWRHPREMGKTDIEFS